MGGPVGVWLSLSLFAATAAGQSLDRLPYIQGTTTSSAIVVWTLDGAAAASVRYGTAPDALDQESSSASATQHEVLISGLSPDTRYYYSVVSGGRVLAGDEQHYFTTAPPVGSTDKFRMWVVGDSGTGSARQANVRDAMLGYTGATPPDIYLHLGDMAYGSGTTSEFSNNFFGMYDEIIRNTVVWPTMGNHEGKSADSVAAVGPYFTAYVLPTGAEAGGVASGTEAYYSFDWANVHFVVLESHQSDRSVSGPMLTWLQQDLMAVDADWLIAYWHHPPYTKGSHDSDAEGALIEMRENALPLLEAAGVDLVMAGHSHIYERSWLIDGGYDTPTVDLASIVDNGDGRLLGDGAYEKSVGTVGNEGAVYVVAGHGGTEVAQQSVEHPLMYFTDKENGSCIIDVEDNRLTLVNVQFDGVANDSFTLVKGYALVLGAPNGGELLQSEQPLTISWRMVGAAPAAVDIEYSPDGGATWSSVASGVDGDSYDWTLPEEQTDQAMIRVTGGGFSDTSNGTFVINADNPDATVPFGSLWKYEDSGTDLGTDWLTLDYDDSSWNEGAAPLGFGDGDEATTITATATVPTYYFRHIVDLPGEPTSARLRVLYDDAVVVWINGVRVFDKNAQLGVVYEAFATKVSKDNELAVVELSLNPMPFFDGPNVISVAVKQHPDDTDDLSFDLELLLEGLPEVTVPPPTESDSGCGCEIAGGQDSGGRWFWLAGASVFVFVFSARRRRRRRSAA
jgi:MYXO-CTERM domain-containing protein